MANDGSGNQETPQRPMGALTDEFKNGTGGDNRSTGRILHEDADEKGATQPMQTIPAGEGITQKNPVVLPTEPAPKISARPQAPGVPRPGLIHPPITREQHANPSSPKTK